MPIKRETVRQATSGAFRCRGAPFSQRLTAHTSCVNALSWSRNGRWLASAGDDRHIALWDFHPLDSLSAPFVCAGPRGNVLCLAFSASNNFILSGGIDQVVLQYDVSRMCVSSLGAEGAIRGRFPQHDGSIRAIAPHPHNDEVLLTGSEDGTIILNDMRVRERPSGVGMLSVNAEVTGIQYHPYMEHLFVMSDAKGNCNLRDVRMVFGDQHGSKCLLNYVTKISKSGHSHLSNPEASSLIFDHAGTRLAVTMLHYLPTIYGLWDEWPLATCGGADVDPINIQSTYHYESSFNYVNSCTIKHGSFGSPDTWSECYYGAGSDDFRGYVWHVPEGLASRRRVFNYSDWAAEPHDTTVAFAKSVTGQRVIPVELREPHFLAYGHKSIVNTVLFHPIEPYIATAGIERHIIVHSPFEATPACGKLTKTDRCLRQPLDNRSTERRVPARELYDISDNAEGDDGDAGVIRLFDSILRQEGVPDVFITREWHENSDDFELGSDSDSHWSVSNSE